MMLKQVVLALFEPVATGFGSWKIPKCLENGPFWDQKWVKNGSKRVFSKSDPGPFAMLKQYDITAGRILTRVLNIGTIMVQTPNISTKCPQ